MTEILLFHHVVGLTDGVRAFADELRASGHTVHTPDLFEGRVFESLEAGMTWVHGTLGIPEVIGRGVAAAGRLPPDVVLAGFSLGVLPAQYLVQTRPGALGALLFEACVPVAEFGAAWPDDVPVQIHGMDADPFFAGEGDLDAARRLIDEADDAELFLYHGDRHLFADASLPSYDADAAALLTARVLHFLADREDRADPPGPVDRADDRDGAEAGRP